MIAVLQARRERTNDEKTRNRATDDGSTTSPAVSCLPATEQLSDGGLGVRHLVNGTTEEVGEGLFAHFRPSRSTARSGSAASTANARDSRLLTVPRATPVASAVCCSVRWR